MAINVQNVERFRFIAHKILPLVYDDSLSYYEFLCKVMQKLNEVISSLDNQNGILETFDNEILDWETRTDSKYNNFVNNMDALFDAFKQSEVTARIEFMNALIGSYNASTHYAIGEYVVHDNSVYKCTTATSGEAWNPDHWTQVVYANDLSERESEFESSMQTQWNEFFTQYLKTLGVVQSTGTSTTSVMSQFAVTDKITELNNDLSNKVNYSDIDNTLEITTFIGNNLLDKSTIVKYTRINTDGSVTNPNPETLSNYWTSQLIPIDSSKTYHTNTDMNIRICQYDENGNALNGSGANYANTGLKTPFTPLSNCTHIRIQGYMGGQETWLVFCLESVKVQKQIDMPYGEYKKINVKVDTEFDKNSELPLSNSTISNFIDNSNIREKIEIVHTDNIMDFYNSMVSAYEKGNCDVYIHEGEYVFTNELIDGIRAGLYNSYKSGVPIGHGCNYFFDTNAVLTCEYTGENADDVANGFAVLDSIRSAHSWGLYNLNLNTKGVLYAIHDEAQGQPEHYKRVYENCYVTFDSTGVGSDINKCIGGGAGGNGEVIIKNCYFKTINPLSTRCPDVTYHGSSANQKNNVKFIVDGCYFEHGFECHSVGGEGYMKLLYSNNSSVLKINTNESGANKWIIRSWNNDYRTT